MGTIITKRLSDEQTKVLTTTFLAKLGSKLKQKREKINLSQRELASCLKVEQSTLSKYENGTRDMDVSLLPLYSAYCNFPVRDLFPEDESKQILETFASAVTIVAERRRRVQLSQWEKGIVEDHYNRSNFALSNANKYSKSMYKYCMVATEIEPCSEAEFIDYIKNNKPDIMDSIINAGQFLNSIEDLSNRYTVKSAVADFVLDEIIINKMSNKPTLSDLRIYAYYCRLFQNTWDNVCNRNNFK